MTKLYLAGHLSAKTPQTLEGQLREEMLMVMLAQQQDADLERDLLFLQTTFPHQFFKPESLKQMIRRTRVLQTYREGDVTAMASAGKAVQGLEELRQLWKIMKEEGIL